MLEVTDLEAGYGPLKILYGISLGVKQGQTVAVLGGNGSGKSTTIKAVIGLLRATAGQIVFDGERIERLPSHEIFRRGIALSPQYRELFKEMTVAENLELGYLLRGPKGAERRHLQETILDYLPLLRDRMGTRAGSLSGGEQQMLATARALASRPKLLILDEPTAGLAPVMVNEIVAIIRRLKAAGQTILLVEQNVRVALQVADFVYGLRIGRVEIELDRAAIGDEEDLFKLYMT
jgi:branched-chain amino acid transport system ATP-binding protein